MLSPLIKMACALAQDCLSRGIDWNSWHTPRDLPVSIHDLIHDIVDQKLLVQEQHPKIFTERALAYLTASRFGLAENEIGRALGCDRDVRAEFQENEKTNGNGMMINLYLPSCGHAYFLICRLIWICSDRRQSVDTVVSP